MAQNSKIYHNFSDKFGNVYKFDNYLSFASFWFGLSRVVAKTWFPTNFNRLQNCAANSKEARTKVL